MVGCTISMRLTWQVEEKVPDTDKIHFVDKIVTEFSSQSDILNS